MENVQRLYEIRRIYNDYLTETERLATTRKVSEGLLGFGKGPGADISHDHFSERLEKALNDMAAETPSPDTALAVLRFVYDAPLTYKNNMLAYWMLMGAHSLTEKLIPFLSVDDAAGLTAWYVEAYPKKARLPAQKKIVTLLLAKAGGGIARKMRDAHEKRSLWDKIRGRDK